MVPRQRTCYTSFMVAIASAGVWLKLAKITCSIIAARPCRVVIHQLLMDLRTLIVSIDGRSARYSTLVVLTEGHAVFSDARSQLLRASMMGSSASPRSR